MHRHGTQQRYRRGAMTPDMAPTSERELQEQVVALADLYGWLRYHTFDSRRSSPGFPDLVAVHPLRPEWGIIALELKAKRGRVTPAQQAWIMALRRAGAHAQVVR
ncbi:MAG: VRR-NUC domain-containing protein, partial [Chloroflexi bacterium]